MIERRSVLLEKGSLASHAMRTVPRDPLKSRRRRTKKKKGAAVRISAVETSRRWPLLTTKNIDMRIAVATNPNDIASTELSKCLQWSSLSEFSDAIAAAGDGTVIQLSSAPILPTKAEENFFKKKQQ
ncbi:unnamed protein product [Linum trigynum]|uniref:Uncharacterized protein n=1 Tax=Linum trigynum TaxID=586398 RepID=A0AAV2G611_9ROSI